MLGAHLSILYGACATEKPVPLAGGNARIVCLSPAAGQVLLELGAVGLIVAADAQTASRTGPTSIAVIGELPLDLTDLDPTHVLLDRETGSRDLPADSDVVQYRFAPTTIEDVLDAYRDLGRIVDKPEQAEVLVQQMIRELAAVSASTYGLVRPRVALVAHSEGWHTVGGNSYVTNLIEIGGGENILESLAGERPAVDLGALEVLRPDVVLDATGYIPASAEEAAATAFWASRQWATRVEFLPRRVIDDPGPAMPQHARAIRKALFPEQQVFIEPRRH